MKKSFLATAALALGMAAVVPATASADHSVPTLAAIQLSDSASDDANGFDTNWSDYDIVTQAVLLFPDLTTAVSDPNASLTAFLPNDAAFRLLVENLTNAWPKTEKAAFNAVATLGTDTVKNVLLYHLLGAKVGLDTVLVSNGVRVPTLLAGTNFKINIRGGVVKQRSQREEPGGHCAEPRGRGLERLRSWHQQGAASGRSARPTELNRERGGSRPDLVRLGIVKNRI